MTGPIASMFIPLGYAELQVAMEIHLILAAITENSAILVMDFCTRYNFRVLKSARLGSSDVVIPATKQTIARNGKWSALSLPGIPNFREWSDKNEEISN
jgi:hypothetical protein